ncbi:hypothetical protein BU15DRAFT_76293 [Melanogaster broomeanus]|nr:hypothetical protein BU15DRAFT_76293 [Melanogaster broomeanus]
MSYPQPVKILGDSVVCPSRLLTSSLTEGFIPNPLLDEDEVRLEANGEESKDLVRTEGKETKVLVQAEDNAFASQSFAAFPHHHKSPFRRRTLTSEASLENYKWVSVVAPDSMTDVWLTILHFCDVPEIIRVGMTCLSLYLLTQHSHAVWYHVLLRIAQDKRLYSLIHRIPSLPTDVLRRKAILAAKLDHLCQHSRSVIFPHATSSLALPLGISRAWNITFIPGGEWLVMLYKSEQNNRVGLLLCKVDAAASDKRKFRQLECVHAWSSFQVFTSDTGDPLLLLRQDHPDATTLGVGYVDMSSYPAKVVMTTTIEVPPLDGCCPLGNYIACGWTDSATTNPYDLSSTLPRHFVGVMKLDLTYARVTHRSTIELKYRNGNHIPRAKTMTAGLITGNKWSYGLRIDTEGCLSVLVSHRTLVAAYRIPDPELWAVPYHTVPMTPFWSFPVHRLAPRAVYLVPSVPTVDQPSILIYHTGRCLFLAPDFDADPRGRHPTYFSTYAVRPCFQAALTFGPHRAFWDLGNGRVQTRVLPTPLQPIFYDEDSDYWDLGGVNASEGSLGIGMRSLTAVEDFDGRLSKGAWDEESGRLVVAPAELERWDAKWTGVAKMLHIVDIAES